MAFSQEQVAKNVQNIRDGICWECEVLLEDGWCQLCKRRLTISGEEVEELIPVMPEARGKGPLSGAILSDGYVFQLEDGSRIELGPDDSFPQEPSWMVTTWTLPS